MLRIVRYLSLCIASIALAGPGLAQVAQYPERPVKIIVPIGAGSTTDFIARLLADQLGNKLGQAFVVENRPGAGGAIGTGMVAKAGADGYTLLIASSSHSTNPVLNSALPYNTVEDFAGISLLVRLPNILVTSSAKGYRSMKAMVESGQREPGKLSYGSNGVGSGSHMNVELFRSLAKFEAVHVPYKGSADLVNALIGGQVDFAFVPITTALPFIRDQRLIALAAGSSERTPLLPEVPTTVEAGIAGSAHNEWIGFFARAGTPQPILQRLNAEVHRALAEPAVVERLATVGTAPAPTGTRELDAFVKSSIESAERTVKLVGIPKNQ